MKTKYQYFLYHSHYTGKDYIYRLNCDNHNIDWMPIDDSTKKKEWMFVKSPRSTLKALHVVGSIEISEQEVFLKLL